MGTAYYVNWVAAQVPCSLHDAQVMTLKLEIVSEHRDIVGDDAVREFHEEGGTIGRSLQNDWILPDPDRYISGRHATIDYQAGAYYLADTSSNGVFVNGDCEPLGKGNPRRLFNGDVIRFGDFVVNVTVAAGESVIVPLDDNPVSAADHAGSMVDEDVIKTGLMLLDEEAITGDDEFQSALFGNHDQTGINDAANPADDINPFAMDESLPVTEPLPEPAPSAALADADLDERELIDAFLGGLDIKRSDLDPSVDLYEIMQNAGQVLREYVEGTTQMLASRANMKNVFKLDQTTVLPQNNNPLKLSANSRDSILQLLVGQPGEYLGPRDAVHEVCRDLLFHQDAFIDAMNNAFVEFTDRFEPLELQDGFDRSLGEGLLAKFTGKFKYWAMYATAYRDLTDTGGGRYPQLFAEDFVRAYERQIAEYKRLGGVEEGLKETVILGETDYNPARDFAIDPEISAELEAMNDSPFDSDDLVDPAAVDPDFVDPALLDVDPVHKVKG